MPVPSRFPSCRITRQPAFKSYISKTTQLSFHHSKAFSGKNTTQHPLPHSLETQTYPSRQPLPKARLRHPSDRMLQDPWSPLSTNVLQVGRGSQAKGGRIQDNFQRTRQVQTDGKLCLNTHRHSSPLTPQPAAALKGCKFHCSLRDGSIRAAGKEGFWAGAATTPNLLATLSLWN